MKTLDATRVVVIGEALAAGLTNFSLCEDDQRAGFAAHVARQMGVDLPQALFQPPGIGDAHGFPRLPVRVPFDHQTTVLTPFPPTAPFGNLSVPGLTLADALTRRPVPPLVHADDAKQTALNFVLGSSALLDAGRAAPLTALEYAMGRRPTFAIVELGFAEALEAATSGNAGLLPEPAAFRAQYIELLIALTAAGCDVLITTVPDPMDTAHFSTLAAASRVVKLPAAAIRRDFGLHDDDRITVNGLMEMGLHVVSKRRGLLPAGSILAGEVAAAIARRVSALNQEIVAIAGAHGAALADLHGVVRGVRERGVSVGAKTLTADFLGGFYSLNGYGPGRTGQAVIANHLLEAINQAFATRFEPIDLGRTMEADAVAAYQAPVGPEFRTMAGRIASTRYAAQFAFAFLGIVGGMVAGQLRRKKVPQPAERGSDRPQWTLQLPPGLEQVLPLNTESSYYGDALRPVHTTDVKEAKFGLTGKLLFGGLALLDSRLHGSVRIKFSPPVDNVAHFEVTHPKGLKGEDGRLTAPLCFRLPAQRHQVMDGTDIRSAGDLDLITGEVTNLQFNFFFLNSAILALAAVNPSLPKAPLRFPGEYGSAWARFEQRPDGKLDYTAHATTFIPLSVLGQPVRFPMPFASPNGHTASIPGDGTALHPHIHVSTKAPEPPAPGAAVPDLPVNTIREFTASIRENGFGDDFSLNAAELGGPARGRSRLSGRFQVQFGERFGDAVSMAITSLRPGGLLATLPQSPVAAAFGSRIPDSLLGHDEQLRFPKQTYQMNGVAYLDDPLDIAVAAVNVKTGKVIGPLLRRAMITTNWLVAMLELEPRIPRTTFAFRGPASFEARGNGGLVFRYHGTLHLLFPEGFAFPAPDLQHAFLIGEGSALNPFLRFEAMSLSPRAAKSGGVSRVAASSGQEFTYRYDIPADAANASFEYTNHTQDATFLMRGLLWAGALNSSVPTSGDGDTIAFSGYGTWSKDASPALHVVSVQVSTAPAAPYVSILVDGGATSNVNTRPAE